MRVVILNSQAPFVRGGAEYLADSLQVKIQERDHQVEVVRIPFKWYPPETILKHILACRLLKLEAAAPDLVIALKFPVYYVPFANKKLWMLHQFRQVYDLWGTAYQDLPNTPEGYRVRNMIVQADNTYLREVRELYTNSEIVARRLKTFNGIEATGVLYPPLLNPELFRSGPFGNYFFYPSRVVSSKRQAIAIEAMRHIHADFKLVIAGKADTDTYGLELQKKVEEWGLQDRVTLLGWVSDDEKARLMAECYAVLYLPYDEDSYGYVTLEAFQSHKPVIVFTDSGGTDEVMEHGVNGLVLAPTPEALAAGMDQLWANRTATFDMGEHAFETLKKHKISWDYVLERLLS